MFKWTIIGNLVRDAELQYIANGKPLARFTVAVNMGWGDNKSVSFVRCTIFGKRAEALAQFLVKGVKVYIEAEPYFDGGKPRMFTRENGEVDVSLDATVREIEIMSWKKKQQQDNDDYAAEVPDIPTEEDEIPF